MSRALAYLTDRLSWNCCSPLMEERLMMLHHDIEVAHKTYALCAWRNASNHILSELRDCLTWLLGDSLLEYAFGYDDDDYQDNYENTWDDETTWGNGSTTTPTTETSDVPLITTLPIFCNSGSSTSSKAIQVADQSPDEHADPTPDDRADSTADDRAVAAYNYNSADSTANGCADSTADDRVDSTADGYSASAANERADLTADGLADSTADDRADSNADDCADPSADNRADPTADAPLCADPPERRVTTDYRPGTDLPIESTTDPALNRHSIAIFLSTMTSGVKGFRCHDRAVFTADDRDVSADNRADSTANGLADSTADDRADSTADDHPVPAADERVDPNADDRADFTADDRADPNADDRAETSSDDHADPTADAPLCADPPERRAHNGLPPRQRPANRVDDRPGT